MKTIHWKDFLAPRLDGKIVKFTAHTCDSWGFEFLENIQKMPKKKPITFEGAILLYGRAAHRLTNHPRMTGRDIGRWINTRGGFLGCVSVLGYHIVLRGDEYLVTHGKSKEDQNGKN
jgi:hypothetical protein